MIDQASAPRRAVGDGLPRTTLPAAGADRLTVDETGTLIHAAHLKWLRRGLATFVGLLAVALICGLLSAVLSSMGDPVGSRVFRRMTLGLAVADGVCGIGLLIGAVWSLISLLEAPSPSRKL